MRILGAAAGKQEDGFRLARDIACNRRVGLRPLVRGGGQAGDGVCLIRNSDDASIVEMLASLEQRVGDIGEALFRMRGDVSGETRSCVVQGFPAFGRSHEKLRALRVAANSGWLPWCFFDNRVRVGAADAKRVHAGAAGRWAFRPRREPIVDDKRTIGEVDRWIGLLETQGWRHLAVLHGQNGFDQADHASSRIEMSDVGFHRTDATEAALVGGLAKRLSERLDLDGIAKIGACAVALDIADGICVDTGERLGFHDGFGLACDARREISGLGRAVVIDRGGFDDGVDRIAVGECVFQTAEHDDAGSAAEHGPGGPVIESAAVAVG